MNKAAIHEPPPIKNAQPHVADMVANDVMTLLGQYKIAQDIMARKQMGMEKYGIPLQPSNGRNAVMDCYQELLDAANYMRQYMYEESIDGESSNYNHYLWLTKYQNLLELISFIQGHLPLKY